MIARDAQGDALRDRACAASAQRDLEAVPGSRAAAPVVAQHQQHGVAYRRSGRAGACRAKGDRRVEPRASGKQPQRIRDEPLRRNAFSQRRPALRVAFVVHESP
jgi:hypothetical protein